LRGPASPVDMSTQPPALHAQSEAWAMEIGRLDAHDQAGLVRSGQLSATELVEAALIRAKVLDPHIASISHRADASARAMARGDLGPGPVAGVPYLIKDSLDYIGMPSRAASRSRTSRLATGQYPLADRFDAAGLVAIGKSSMPEFALLPSNEPLLYGPVRNPWDLKRSAGGSSGGAAAAVAAGIVPFAHASDGGGSIRIPASCCGLPGLKPTRGANVRARVQHAVEDLLAGDGLLARSMRDLAQGFEIGLPQDAVQTPPKQGSLRIGLVLTGLHGQLPAPEVASATEAAARLCEDLGHIVEPVVALPGGDGVLAGFRTLWAYLADEVVRGATDAQELEPWTRGMAAETGFRTLAELEAAYTCMIRSGQENARFHERYDILLSPVNRSAPPALGHLAPDRLFGALVEDMFDYLAYTPLQNLAGTPSLSLPLFTGQDGIPIGSMFSAPRGGDRQLLDLGAALEDALPWKDRWPELSA